MPPLTTHVLDTALGKPAAGLAIKLEIQSAEDKSWSDVGAGVTNGDGRLEASLIPEEAGLQASVYRITFDTEGYCTATGRECFYPEVSVVFRITAPGDHYHVPLLLSPFGYSTYRGS